MSLWKHQKKVAKDLGILPDLYSQTEKGVKSIMKVVFQEKEFLDNAEVDSFFHKKRICYKNEILL